MPEPYFLFDLDSVIAKSEVLPFLARNIDLEETVQKIAEQARLGFLPFEESLQLQLELLRPLSVSTAQDILTRLPLHQQLTQWISSHSHQCLIATELPDVWLTPLLKQMNMEGRCFSSKTAVLNNTFDAITYFLKKQEIIPHLPCPVVAVGNGGNNTEMLSQAKTSIGFGGTYPIVHSIRDCADYLVFEEAQLCTLLEELAQTRPALAAIDIYSPVF